MTETALHYGERVTVTDPESGMVATATYVGYAGSRDSRGRVPVPKALVRLDGTEALVNVPRSWIRREASLNPAP